MVDVAPADSTLPNQQEAHEPGEQYPRRWLALTVLALAQVVLVLDSTVVNVALPSIQQEFGLDESHLAWIVNGYALAFGGALLLGGSLGDLYGRRRLFLIGLALFTAGSLVAGLAWDANVVVAMRFVQGVGAAMVSPAALSSISRIFTERRERARALGLWGGLSALGGVAGVVLSGVITEFASWRWVFLITVPITLVALVLAPKLVPESRAPSRPPLDVVGVVLITLAIGIAVFALLDKGAAPWTDGTLLIRLAVAATLLVAFIGWESRVARPMVPLDIFKNRNRAVGVTAAVLFGSVFSTYFFSTTLYMQGVLEYSPLKTGFAYLPFGLVVLVAFPVVSLLVGRIGVRLVMTSGLLIAVCGLIALSRIRPDGTYVGDVLPGMVLLALGAACGFVTFTIAGVDGTTDENAGIASGILNAGSQIGSALGLATLVAIAVSVQADELASGTSFAQASVDGFRASYLVGIGILLLGAVATATLLRPSAVRRDRV
jgi:EmrB/QacA subfamily drug resistance transporter